MSSSHHTHKHSKSKFFLLTAGCNFIPCIPRERHTPPKSHILGDPLLVHCHLGVWDLANKEPGASVRKKWTMRPWP
ncbi:hypothetical protein XELAEV_18032626mg [Xenopus laevis]|uniref:Uncharacterized protein n=1 Tax=Xenopus laevis TaxID=8355 RepID=A0A974CIA8_XENLA|nr:hypothetical protein XELAEV_18032626mg [Xenopus laevis]